jgi:hypothetical protein
MDSHINLLIKAIKVKKIQTFMIQSHLTKKNSSKLPNVMLQHDQQKINLETT